MNIALLNTRKYNKFGLDKQANQKYQCKKFRRQFAPDSVSTPKESKYPKCPKCGNATFLYHAYKHYNRYKCGNKKFGEPSNFITDRFPSYNQAVAKVLPNTKHIPVAPMSNDTSNTLIESFNKTFKALYKTKKGFNSFEKANNLISVFMFHYNFIIPHGSFNNHTPAEVASFASDSKSKHSWFVAA